MSNCGAIQLYWMGAMSHDVRAARRNHHGRSVKSAAVARDRLAVSLAYQDPFRPLVIPKWNEPGEHVCDSQAVAVIGQARLEAAAQDCGFAGIAGGKAVTLAAAMPGELLDQVD